MAEPSESTVAMVGAGQLARMAWQAAISLDLGLVCLGEPGDAAIRAGAQLLTGSAKDPAALGELAGRGDVLTFEHELVDLDTVRALEAAGVAVRPSAAVLELAADKLHQRRTLSERPGLSVPAFAPAPNPEAVVDFVDQFGAPVVLKAVRGGYDGRGVWMCPDPEAVAAAFADAAAGGLTLYVEEAVDLAGEAAIIVARSPSGQVAVFPLVDTRQVDGMCREVVLPSRVDPATAEQAHTLATRLAEAVGLEGLMAIELFLTADGGLLINELALRTHNTGHIHTEAAVTSQFEQHLRAVLDLPLGDPSPRAPAAAMVNIVGPPDGSDPADRRAHALAVPGAHVHLYGKTARPGRKLGHVTVCDDTPEDALARAREAAARLEGHA
ncbi:5-(carboxyamino)imidazole ribonucleotide synthase [Conexibacter sp. DBS9H8]|uniref:5-(carboxyamino)imidazole ribonucleotide synthase n=1 Tax=Conexibacter sp. DBS9H8 TaxID=2937801 RepID=UPI00200EB9E3|nr:5-(carboxyamino)imidazole ribonucleotide synthase [Conexibacter sp. DBS9H8]